MFETFFNRNKKPDDTELKQAIARGDATPTIASAFEDGESREHLATYLDSVDLRTQDGQLMLLEFFRVSSMFKDVKYERLREIGNMDRANPIAHAVSGALMGFLGGAFVGGIAGKPLVTLQVGAATAAVGAVGALIAYCDSKEKYDAIKPKLREFEAMLEPIKVKFHKTLLGSEISEWELSNSEYIDSLEAKINSEGPLMAYGTA